MSLGVMSPQNGLMEPARIPVVGPLWNWGQAAIRNWHDFWFTPVDAAPLGLMRILAGGMLFYSHLVWGLQLEAFLGPDGWNSAELIQLMQQDSWAFSFWWHVPAAWFHEVHAVCLVILAMFWLGIGTRVTSILAFAIHASYCNRAQLSDYGLDQISAILAMYLMIGPSGANYSLDSVFRRWRIARKCLSQGETHIPAMPTISAAAGFALRLTQVHYCVIYFFAGLSKLQGRTWWTGEAMWRAFANYEYQSTDLTWLAAWPWILQLLALTTLLWEISFAYLIWNRHWKPLMLAAGLGMHFGIGACMGMWTFGMMMMFGYVCFISGVSVRAWVNRLLGWWPGRLAMTIVVDRTPESVRHLSWIKAWDGENRIQIQWRQAPEVSAPITEIPAFVTDPIELLELPSEIEEAVAAEPVSDPPAITSWQSLSPAILCVHADSNFVNQLVQEYADTDIEVIAVTSMSEADELLPTRRIDAILCDCAVGNEAALVHACQEWSQASAPPVSCFLLTLPLARSLGPALREQGGATLLAPISPRGVRHKLDELLAHRREKNRESSAV